MQTTRRVTALLLSLLLLLPMYVQAAESGTTVAQRQEDFNDLLDMIAETHPNMYANTSEQEVASRKAYIEKNLATWDDFTFAVELQTLVAMLKDSHTQVSIGDLSKEKMLPIGLEWWDGSWYLTGIASDQQACLGWEVTAINGKTMAAVQQALTPFFSADNEIKQRRSFSQSVYLWKILAHFGVVEADQETASLSLRSSDGQIKELTLTPMTREEIQQIDISRLQDKRAKVPETEPVQQYYIWKDLGNGNFYIQYNSCSEDPDLPMETFAAQVAAQLESNQYGRVIVDFRNNGGGSDGVVWPLFLELLKVQQRGGELVALIGEATFSSAIINSVQLQQMGAILIGEPTAGSVSHFGAVKRGQLPNSQLTLGISTKYIDLGEYYAAAKDVGVAPLQPEVPANQTLADYLKGEDTAVNQATATPAPSLQQTAVASPSSLTVKVNGKQSGLTGYLIGNEQYVAIRDLAAALQETSVQFDVTWHGTEQVVEMIPGRHYTAVGNELAPLPSGNRTAEASSALLSQEQMPIQLYGQPGGLLVYQIENRNYLRLRDLGNKLGFTVQWNQEKSQVELTTK